MTIELNEKEQTILKQIAQQQQQLQAELNRTVSLFLASKDLEIPKTGVQISDDLKTLTFEIDIVEEAEVIE